MEEVQLKIQFQCYFRIKIAKTSKERLKRMCRQTHVRNSKNKFNKQYLMGGGGT